ncbi:DNA/RNA non-specific endonuclease [Kineococcus sp. G2]|uniref:DNA/RNA non-specific endonuclease n=1 Tax=Kineococcus sp. G2 TaxID=3127484 RepID=UPI00301DB1A7
MSETPTAEVAAGPVTAAAADLSGRAGYDPGFLAPGPVVPLPVPTDGTEVVVLPYTHFSVVLRPDRRLAAATAVTVDGAALRDVERGDDWFLDPRVGPDAQAGAELYARNDFDRGHLVRRRDPVWGAPAEARRANADTFSYTNAAPQASGFNQSLELWLGLEDHVLAHAREHDARLVVLTGPVFADDDPEYRGVRVPRRFFKVAGYLLDEGAPGAAGPVLASAGFVLDQTPLVEEVLRSEATAQHAPELGAFRTFQVPVADVAELTALDLEPLVAADRMPALVPAAAAEGDGVPMWRALSAPGDLLL